MKNRSIFSHISTKLFLTSIIPLLIVTGIITWHTIDSRTREQEAVLEQTALLTAVSLASTSDFALYTGRTDLLAPAANSARNLPSISAVLFLSAEEDVVYATALPSPLDLTEFVSHGFKPANERFFVAKTPVFSADTDVTDFDETKEKLKTILGWVVIVADRADIKVKAQQILVSHLLISFVVLLGSLLLSYLLSYSVVSPIRKMTKVVRDLERGNLDSRIQPTTQDELAILANGINLLARTVSEGKSTLENKVSFATRELQHTLENLKQKNIQLENARLEAESANQTKSSFLAQMSHELRTPITAIQGFVNLLETSAMNPSEKRYCDIIQQASFQLLQLIDDILDLTKLQSGSLNLESSPFYLMDCIEHPVTLMAPIAHGKQLELILDVTPDVSLNLIGDSLRLRQIVYNLVSNAIKFTPAGHVIVKVRARPGNNNDILVIIHVIDTGIGVSEKQREQIFEPFSQADNSISRRFGGSGLGLTIVRNLVALMYGGISLQSIKGKGSIFTVEIPLQISPSQPNLDFDSQYRNVVLYDSYPESRQALEQLIAPFARDLESCDSLEDLIQGQLALVPDLLILSCPANTSTDSLISDLRALRRHNHCPIVLISPLGTMMLNNTSTALTDLGPLFFMDKPATQRELVSIFNNSTQETVHQTTQPYLQAHILVAEDNEFTRILLTTHLDKLGCSYATACNGKEAFEISRETPFDLILMDVHMPVANGIEALQWIRANQGPNQATPILMLTADIVQQEEKAVFDAGASDLLFKPLDEKKLFSAIQQHIQVAQSSLQVATNAPTTKKHNGISKKQFYDEVLRLTLQAQSAIEDRDAKVLREIIHQLLGVAGVFKMPNLERAVAALHSAVKSQNEEKTLAAMKTLLDEVRGLEVQTH